MTTHDQEAIAPPPGRYSGSHSAARTRCAALRALSAVGHGGQARLGQHPAGKSWSHRDALDELARRAGLAA